jgi:hypothetical protein
MNEKKLSLICLLITLSSMLILVATYKEEFHPTTIKFLLDNGGKGIISGRVEHVVKNYPVSVFVLNDGTKTTIYSPKALSITTNDFVRVYAENQFETGKSGQNIFAHKVVKE